MSKKNRFPNIAFALTGILALYFSLKTIIKPLEGKYLISNLPQVLRVTILVVIVLVIVFWFIPSFLIKFKHLLKIVLLSIVGMFLLEFLLMPIINSYFLVKDLQRIPSRTRFLDSTIFIIINHWQDFLRGLGVTLLLSLVGTIIGLILALFFVFFRTLTINEYDNEIIVFLKKTANVFTKTYVNVFRGTPMMVQAVIIYYLAPIAIASLLGISQARIDAVFTLMVAGLVVVSLNTAAYLTEVLRGGIEAVEKGQYEAARSLGMGHFQTMFLIVFPQGIKNALPSICNEFLINIKDTSVLNVIGVAELFFMAQDAKYQYYRSYEPFIIAAAIYLVVTLSISSIIFRIGKKLNIEVKELPSCN